MGSRNDSGGRLGDPERMVKNDEGSKAHLCMYPVAVHPTSQPSFKYAGQSNNMIRS